MMMFRGVKEKLLFVSLIILAAMPASAYEVSEGDIVLRALVGARVQALRLETVTKETPKGAMLLGGEFDLVLSGPFAFSSSITLGVSSDFLSTEVGAGLRYRLLAFDAPLVPFVGGRGVLNIGVPLDPGVSHYGIGLRPDLGVEYFFTRTLALSLATSVTVSYLIVPDGVIEVHPETSLGLSWRF